MSSRPAARDVMQGQAALLSMLTDACVTAATLGEVNEAETLRRSLSELFPDYTDHLPLYALAWIGHDRLDLAEDVLRQGQLPGPRAELGRCVYALLLMMRDDPAGRHTLEELSRCGADKEVRHMAQQCCALTAT